MIEQERPVVAIVGAGFAGTMTAVHLLRAGHHPLDVVLVERSGTFGRGVAYATGDPGHLLNVPAELMSAFCEQPLHFAAWAHRELGRSGPAEFVPRRAYGDYLEAILEEVERQLPAERRLRRVTGEAVAALAGPDGVALRLADGGEVACDRLVLALGPIESPPPFPEGGGDERIVTDPWREGLGAGGEGPVLVVGMGLTAVDQILTLADSGVGPIVAVSRSGRFPFAHLPGLRFPVPPPRIPAGTVELAPMEELVRGHVTAMAGQGHDWRDVFDGLRPVTPVLWARLSPEAKRAFVAERMRSWERRRHRMAPAVGDRLRALSQERRLVTLAGAVAGVVDHGRGLRVAIAESGGGRSEVECARIVYCTGSGMDVGRAGNPLLRDLLDQRLVSPDPLALGLRAGPSGALIDGRTGRPSRQIFGLGPIRRGELWETTAVGEIRVQARDLGLEIGRSLAAECPEAAAR